MNKILLSTWKSTSPYLTQSYSIIWFLRSTAYIGDYYSDIEEDR